MISALAEVVTDERVLAAMAEVPRHAFVEEAFARRSYDQCSLPIGHGQTISHPLTVALMTAALDLRGSERVLEIGTGSGYQTAVPRAVRERLHGRAHRRPRAASATFAGADGSLQRGPAHRRRDDRLAERGAVRRDHRDGGLPDAAAPAPLAAPLGRPPGGAGWAGGGQALLCLRVTERESGKR